MLAFIKTRSLIFVCACVGLFATTVHADTVGVDDLNLFHTNIDTPTISGGHNRGEIGINGCEAMWYGCDGFVGIEDLNIVLVNWNRTVTPDSYTGRRVYRRRVRRCR